MEEQTFNTNSVGRDILGAGARGVVAKEIRGNVIQIVINSPEVAERLGILDKMPTEVSQTQAAGFEGNTVTKDSELIQENINELLDLLKATRKAGQKVDEIHAGNLHISQVDLLLKKAILIKSDADQMYFDQLGKSQATGGKQSTHASGSFKMDLNQVFANFDERAHTAKLQEAYDLLDEANKLDPTNTEVLLHMAQLLIELTPDDPSDEQKLLRRIQNLLTAPKDDTERFRLAQATFLLATTSDPINYDSLEVARKLFERLGRDEWIRQCDDLLATSKPQMQAPTQSYAPPVAPAPQPEPQSGFQPVGRWNIQVSDFVGSTMTLTIHPNGFFDAVQNTGLLGMSVQASGNWVFTPFQQMLQLQGMLNGFQPFMLGIMMQNQYGNVFYGMGTDGYSYTFNRA